MKRTIAMIVAALMMVFVFTACGQSPFVADWEITDVEMGGIKMEARTANITCSLSIKSDNTATMKMNGDTSPSLKWSESSGTITITSEENSKTETMTGKIEDGKLVLTMTTDGVSAKMYFMKM